MGRAAIREASHFAPIAAAFLAILLVAATVPGRSRGLHARWQIGELPLTAQHGFELGQFLVATMVAAGLDIVGGDMQLSGRLLLQSKRLGGICYDRLQRKIVDEPAKWREGLDICECQARAPQRYIAKKKLHLSWFSDLFDLIEIARSMAPATKATIKSGPCKETIWNAVLTGRSLSGNDQLFVFAARGVCHVRCGLALVSFERHSKIGSGDS
jgi:hypothetical protein